MADPGERARTRLAAQSGAVRALVEAGSTEEALPELMREVCENLGWCAGELWCPAPGDTALARIGVWSKPGIAAPEFLQAGQTARFEPGSGLIGEVAGSGVARWVPDLLDAPDSIRPEGATREDGVRAAFAVPVPLDQGQRGVLAFYANEAVARDPDLIETMEVVGGHLGQFLRRRRIEADLRASEERLRFQGRLLDTVAEAVIVTDPDGRILYWNAFAERLYGWPARDVLGKPIGEVTPAVAARDSAAAVTERMRAGDSWSGEFTVRDRSGREFTALVNKSPIQDEDGRVIGVIGTSIDISDRKREEEGQRFLSEAGQVLASSLDFETTVRSLADLAVPTLGDWCLIHMRVEHGDVVTQPVARVVPPEEADAADALLRMVAQDTTGFVDSVLQAEGAIAGPTDDEASPLARERLQPLGVRSILALPLRARGTVIGVMTFAATRSGREYDDFDTRLAEELARRAALALDNARLYRDAQEANRAKADFLAVVSHELRTPLNAITGYADLLATGVAGPLAAGQLSHVDRIKVGAGHLAHIIDEVLAYARLETGRDVVRLEATDLGSVIREAVIVIEPDATDKGLPIRVDLPDPTPRITTDRGKVRQIVVNLLSNAVKYTNSGEVRVVARGNGDGAVIEVSDTGIGIEPDAQARIFEPFWQAESPNTRAAGGTGLGLSVNRRLLKLLGGTISVESQVGVGSTFTVRLPDST